MFSVVASVLILTSVFSPHIADRSATDETDVNITDSIRRFKDAREEAEEMREDAREELMARRQEAKDAMEARRLEFQEKVAQIRDERKQKVVGNLAERFSSINEKWTTHWNNVLTRLTEILAKIEARNDTLDTSDATAAIAEAQDAVNTQAGMVYEFEIDDEENLGQNVKSAIEAFHADLRETQAVVKAARDAVHQVFRQLKAEDSEGGTDEE